MKDNHVPDHIKEARKRERAEKAKKAGPIIMTRKMARNFAKAAMQEKGIRKINKNFASMWRNYIPTKEA